MNVMSTTSELAEYDAILCTYVLPLAMLVNGSKSLGVWTTDTP